jgi:hypothetical protein
MGRKRVIPPHLESVAYIMHKELLLSYREIAARFTALGVRGEKGQPICHVAVLRAIQRFCKLPGEKQLFFADEARDLLIKSVERNRKYNTEDLI